MFYNVWSGIVGLPGVIVPTSWHRSVVADFKYTRNGVFEGWLSILKTPNIISEGIQIVLEWLEWNSGSSRCHKAVTGPTLSRCSVVAATKSSLNEPAFINM